MVREKPMQEFIPYAWLDVSVAERVACQLPLKDNAFSTFLDQKQLFELRPEIGVSLPAKSLFRRW
jgi:hypothetical protein